MRNFIGIYFLIASTLFANETPSIQKIRENVIAQFAQIEDYKVDLKISVKMTGFRMPKKKLRLYYKKPDKVKVETKGFAILPKTGVDGNPDEFLDMLTDVIDIKHTFREGAPYYEIEGSVNPDSLDIPVAANKNEIPNITMKVFVNADHWVMTDVAVYVDDENVFTFTTDYTEVSGIMVPKKSVFKIGVKGISRWSTQNPFDFGGPGSDRQEFDDIAKEAGYNPEKDEFVGEMVLKFSKYKMNEGIDDSIFED